MKFSAKIVEKLGFYVYLYIDPRSGKPFYIGKGRGNRVFSHLKDRTESEKVEVIDQLARIGQRPQIELLKWGLTEEQALLVEQTAIDLIDVSELTNRVRGHGTRHGGRADVEQVMTQLGAKRVEIAEPAMLIVINRLFRFGMSPQELYDATRSAWKVGPRRHQARYAFAVFRGVVREAYEIATWLAGGSTMRSDDRGERRQINRERWEFVGRIAEEPIRARYVGRSVAHYFKKGAQNPILYLNCERSGSVSVEAAGEE